MSLLSKLTAELGLTPADLAKGNSHLGKLMRTEGVRDTDEFRRVDLLLRRPENPADDPDAIKLARLLTVKYGTPGTMDMRPWQARALSDLHDYGGCLGVGPVGIGKTLVSYLAAKVAGYKRPLLLIPAKLVEKTKRDFAQLSRIWRAPEVRASYPLAIRTYEEIGVVSGEHTLSRVLPDLIIADECHKLRNLTAAVTTRVERYLRDFETYSNGGHPGLLLMSGTILERGVMTFHHLLKWCVGEANNPLPNSSTEAALWGRAVDVKTRELRVSPGVLGAREVVGEDGEVTLVPTTTEAAREWVTSRIRSARGVAWSPAPEVKANLRIRVWSPELPDDIKRALARAEAGFAPDDTQLETEDDQGRVLRTLPLGFWRRWKYPPAPRWLASRRRYWAFVREKIAERIPGMDSEKQVRTACCFYAPVVDWELVQDEFEEPPRETVWVNRDWLLELVPDKPTLIWTWYQDPGLRLQEVSHPYYAEQGLCAAGGFVEDNDGRSSVVLSVAANNEGRNLQHRWHRNLILTQTSSAGAYEQILGRTYRPGQTEDTVYATIYAPTARARSTFASAVEEARQHGGMLLSKADYE